MKTPIYYIRFEQDFYNLPEAEHFKESMQQSNMPLEVGYFIPQPQFKAWVPLFIIRLISKLYTK